MISIFRFGRLYVHRGTSGEGGRAKGEAGGRGESLSFTLSPLSLSLKLSPLQGGIVKVEIVVSL